MAPRKKNEVAVQIFKKLLYCDLRAAKFLNAVAVVLIIKRLFQLNFELLRRDPVFGYQRF